jgi:hypothetical protein
VRTQRTRVFSSLSTRRIYILRRDRAPTRCNLIKRLVISYSDMLVCVLNWRTISDFWLEGAEQTRYRRANKAELPQLCTICLSKVSLSRKGKSSYILFQYWSQLQICNTYKTPAGFSQWKLCSCEVLSYGRHSALAESLEKSKCLLDIIKLEESAGDNYCRQSRREETSLVFNLEQ